MIFKSHLLTMMIFAVIVSTVLAFIKHDEKKDIFRYGLKIFIYMICGVIIVSWIMYHL
ncbi:MAG: hypothetical protein GTO45_16835 [Candidatus Aminicenantes bacterium]|nr:hypothetical protein [Candidatus Aminicenantes bacterium]NIM80408.1 hypothetical protein [Candidatus Aminicenantes bacterium]NIN19795.1 hypothetical protein [Candidatus Aminicenantes bacterium]NIN43677.1 hypothetical protein [Candidatus Aminicenantes bacterium]NIN86422.1 hypothetical protein [Candidatus Aminicenantes bacterium]